MRHTVHEEQAGTLDERIDAAIAAGIRRGRAEAVRRRIRTRRKIGGAAAACVLLFACVFCIRVSPAFAALIRDIPGLEAFVDLIRQSPDQGVRLAMENDFMQPVGVSDEHDGLKFTVQGIVADDSRMVVFYEIQSARPEPHYMVNTVHLTDPAGEPLSASIGSRMPDVPDGETGKSGIQRGTIDIALAAGEKFPDKALWTARLVPLPPSGQPVRAGPESQPQAGRADDSGPEFKVAIPIDHSRFAGLMREYEIGQTITAEGQSVTFAKAVVSPLRVSLYLEYGANNTKQIFSPGDIRLVDDKGTVWNTISGSIGADRNRPVYHFESPYFSEPKSLHVEGSWFRALDKDKLAIVMDTKKMTVLQAPDDRLEIGGVSRSGGLTKFDLTLSRVAEEDNMNYSLLADKFTDASGAAYRMSEAGAWTGSSRSGSIQQSYFYLPDHEYAQPLTFTLFDYPAYIRQDYRIRIK